MKKITFTSNDKHSFLQRVKVVFMDNCIVVTTLLLTEDDRIIRGSIHRKTKYGTLCIRKGFMPKFVIKKIIRHKFFYLLKWLLKK